MFYHILMPLNCDSCPHNVWIVALFTKLCVFYNWASVQPDVLTVVLVLAAGSILPPLHTKLLFWSLTGSQQSSQNKRRESKNTITPLTLSGSSPALTPWPQRDCVQRRPAASRMGSPVSLFAHSGSCNVDRRVKGKLDSSEVWGVSRAAVRGREGRWGSWLGALCIRWVIFTQDE